MDELQKNIKKELSDGHNQDVIIKTSKRINDLDRIWKRFLVRVQNREKVLTSLHQFLLESVKVSIIHHRYNNEYHRLID